jgi:hypothetical protein
MHISYVQPLQHVEGMLVAYLPNEKILIEADLYDSSGSAKTPTAENKALYNHVKRLRLDVTDIAPIHGPAVSWRQFATLIGER